MVLSDIVRSGKRRSCVIIEEDDNIYDDFIKYQLDTSFIRILPSITCTSFSLHLRHEVLWIVAGIANVGDRNFRGGMIWIEKQDVITEACCNSEHRMTLVIIMTASKGDWTAGRLEGVVKEMLPSNIIRSVTIIRSNREIMSRIQWITCDIREAYI